MMLKLNLGINTMLTRYLFEQFIVEHKTTKSYLFWLQRCSDTSAKLSVGSREVFRKYTSSRVIYLNVIVLHWMLICAYLILFIRRTRLAWAQINYKTKTVNNSWRMLSYSNVCKVLFKIIVFLMITSVVVMWEHSDLVIF